MKDEERKKSHTGNYKKWSDHTWVLLLLIWQTGSLFYSDDFLPGPVTTFAGAGKLVASGELFRDILISMQRVLKGWLLGGNRLSDLHIKTLL